jgi:hypothetical protein
MDTPNADPMTKNKNILRTLAQRTHYTSNNYIISIEC